MTRNDKWYPYPNEGVMGNNLNQKKEGKRSYMFYPAYNHKSYQAPADDNPMDYVSWADSLKETDYDKWKEVINDTRYFHDDDGDVAIGVLSEDWGKHKKGAYVVFPKAGLNGHWVAIEEQRQKSTEMINIDINNMAYYCQFYNGKSCEDKKAKGGK